ncbi:DUF1697 domain-containing protein [Granulicella arctica]|uniref:DUF1697 domain-containing protein n=1 Tax=Granulicella arctica TaxID=940613 RepID=UPI0021DF7F57|nr:DUF1697 domain-containing protein [Granulicella arctica]
MPTHVAFLRGINVGGKNKLPMKDLAEIFAVGGCTAIQTYIQSGNVLFAADPAQVNIDTLPEQIADAIRDRFGLRVPVVLRSAAEMKKALARNPFVQAGIAEDLLHVYFLANAGASDAIKALDCERSPGDTFVVARREIYLHLPNGVARTKLTNAYFDKQLATVSTLRNWRTVQTLCNLMEGPVQVALD